MMELTQKMIDFIYYVQRSTDTNLKQVKRGHSPHWHDLQAETRTKYKYDGENVAVADGTIFIIKNMPFYAGINGRLLWLKTMQEAIDSNLIEPFILLRQDNGSDKCYPIPWSDIIVIRNYNYTYLIIDGIYTNVKTLRAIGIPRKTVYSTTVTSEPDIGFLFDSTGKFIVTYGSSTPSQVYTVHASDITITKLISFNSTSKGFTVDMGTVGQKIFLEDLLVVYEDYIVSNTEDYVTYLGGNAFRFKQGIDPTKCKIIVVYYNTSNLSLDNIRTKLSHTELNSEANKDVNGNASQAYINMKPSLDLTNAHTLLDKWYAIIAYNQDLYKDNTGEDLPLDDGLFDEPVLIRKYSGLEIKNTITDNVARVTNYRWIDKFKNSTIITIDSYDAIVYCNGVLLNRAVTVAQSTISFNTSGMTILDTDVFEFIFTAFDDSTKFADYSASLTGFKKSEAQLAIDAGLHVSNIALFESTPVHDEEFDLTDVNVFNDEFSIPYTNAITSELNDSFCNITAVEQSRYADVTDFTCRARNRYAYMKTVVTDEEQIGFNLSSDFAFCQEINHYLVLINGKRISHKYLKVTRPKHDNAFYSVKLFSQVPAKRNDIVEVYYLPVEMDEIIVKASLDQHGTYTITDLGLLPYKLDNEWYWIYLNGKKVAAEHVLYPSNDTISINSPIYSNTNFELIFIRSYINGVKETTITATSDIYDDYTDAEISNALNLPGLNSIEVDIYGDIYDRKSLIKYIISEYYGSINTSKYMSYAEVESQDEIEIVNSLSSRANVDENTIDGVSYSVYKIGSYESPYDIDLTFYNIDFSIANNGHLVAIYDDTYSDEPLYYFNITDGTLSLYGDSSDLTIPQFEIIGSNLVVTQQ